MYNRFNNYLTNEFRGLPKSKEVSDFKEELLGALMEKAEELSNNGEENENEIFQVCIKSINGFKDTLKVLKGKPIIVKEAKRAINIFMYVLLYFLVVVGVYLAVSFSTNSWSRSWLIIVGGSFLFAIATNAFLSFKAFMKKKFVIGRISMIFALVFAVVGVYLGISFFYGMWAKTWLIMLWLPVAILVADTIALLFLKYYKAAFGEVLAILPMISVFIYLTLALFGVLAWHPFWLIILGGVFIDIAIITVALKIRVNK